MLSWLKKANPSLQQPTFPGQPNPADTENPLHTATDNRGVEKAMEEAASRKRKRGSNGQYDVETRVNPSLQWPTFPGLPNPADTENPLLTAAANREVEKVIREAASRKRKRGSYGQYTAEARAKIAKLCIEIGPTKAAEKMSEEVGRQLNESTVRSIRKSYEKEVKRQGNNNIPSFPRKTAGQPLKLGDLDADVQKFVRDTKENGGVVSRALVMSAAKRIVSQKDRSLLSEYGGPIVITQAWANSFLHRMNCVERKGAKAARK
ncbi:Hypp8025 [Branchiostoma lanceolatum]|uniref:Hypp8025 protein n=1 Tax=Branchiostoma lanceolatum TaxID=7740 RepID=A0A8K0ECD5_BRALA|nr:Hypp8025 [Branchiostoma lanceolatum]